MVEEKWNTYSGKGSSISVFKDKLKCLKADLKMLNHDVFGHLESEKKNIVKEIEELDGQDDGDGLPESFEDEKVDPLQSCSND